MSREDLVRHIEKSIVESQEIANDVAAVTCFHCGEVVKVDPATMVPEPDAAEEWVIEAFDKVEPAEVRIFCSGECKKQHRWEAIE